MDSSLVMILTVVVACTVVPILFLLQQYTFSNRQVQMRGLANELGLEFLTSIPVNQVGSIATSRLLQKSDQGRVINLMCGETDLARIQIFDFEYEIQYHRHRKTYRQTVVAMMFSGMQLAPCRIYPESCWNFIGELLGDQDINFADHPEFSRRFVVQSHHEAETRAMLDRELMEFFCQDPQRNFESTRTAFLLYEPETVLSVDQIRAKMKDAYSLYQQLLASQERRLAGNAGKRYAKSQRPDVLPVASQESSENTGASVRIPSQR